MSAAVPSAPPPGGPSVPVGEATTSRASDRPPVVVVVQTPEAKKTPFEKYVRSTKRTGVVVFSSLLLILSGLSSIIIEICIQTRADVETRAWQRHYNSYRASSGYSYSEIWLTETFAWAKVGQGFWCGILLFLNGCYGFRIHRDAKQTECSLVKLFWFSMVSTLVCIASVTVSFGALSRTMWGTFYFLRPTLIALIIDTFFSMVLTVAICCVSCKIACCPGRKQNDSGDEAMTQQQLTEIITSAVTTNQSSQEMSRLVSRAVARQAATGQRMTNRQLRQVITSAVTAATAAQHTEQESLQSENQASPPPPYSKAVAES